MTDTSADTGTRRIEITLHRPWFALSVGARPTLVIAGLGHPAQFGLGTWLVPAHETVTVGVFLFNRVWRFGQAEFALDPGQPPALIYQAPILPFLPGRMRLGSPSASASAPPDAPAPRRAR